MPKASKGETMTKDLEAHTPAGTASVRNMELIALADRCEREEPSEELCDAIAFAIGWRLREAIWWREPAGPIPQWIMGHPDFCRSIDAALTLVPENSAWEVASRGDAEVTVLCGRFLVSDDIERHGRAKTPAMALCAAALRARAPVR